MDSRLSRVSVKVERGSTFTLTCGLSYISYLIYAPKSGLNLCILGGSIAYKENALF